MKIESTYLFQAYYNIDRDLDVVAEVARKFEIMRSLFEQRQYNSALKREIQDYIESDSFWKNNNYALEISKDIQDNTIVLDLKEINE